MSGGAEEQLRERNRQLEARIGALYSLLRLSDLLRDAGTDAAGKLEQVPALLVSGLRFPDRARVLIETDAHRFDLDWSEPNGPHCREPILAGGVEQGAVHVAYAPDEAAAEPDADERAFVRAIATRIGEMLDRDRAESERLAVRDHQRRSDRMDAMSRLAGRIAHDFNNLLTSIRGLTSLALKELEPAHPIRPDLDEIQKAAQRAADLTRQLVAISRRNPLELVPVDLNAAVASARTRLQPEIGVRIHLRVTCAPDLPLVLADPKQLDQIVTNLVVNARDALPNGGTIEIETRLVHSTDDRSPVPTGRYAALTVRDDGTGIAPEDVDRVFEPFSTRVADREGAGFGLATAFVIAQQSGGYIDVESRAGVGSTFRVLLPLAGDPAQRDRQESAVGATARRRHGPAPDRSPNVPE